MTWLRAFVDAVGLVVLMIVSALIGVSCIATVFFLADSHPIYLAVGLLVGLIAIVTIINKRSTSS